MPARWRGLIATGAINIYIAFLTAEYRMANLESAKNNPQNLLPKMKEMGKNHPRVAEKGEKMKNRSGCFVFGIFLAGFSAAFAAAQGATITVMNPKGIQPLIRRIPMAERPVTLDGKTIYVVDTKYPRTREFVEELFNVLREKFPKTNWVLREKFGGYIDDDPKLWSEIREKGHGMILAVGH